MKKNSPNIKKIFHYFYVCRYSYLVFNLRKLVTPRYPNMIMRGESIVHVLRIYRCRLYTTFEELSDIKVAQNGTNR
jgi:hypothetical protein